MFLKLRLHADSGITNNELVASISGRRRFQLFYPDADGASNFVEFNTIAQNIQQHLCQSQFIRNNILISYVHCINEKIQLLEAILGCTIGTDIIGADLADAADSSLIFTLPLSILLLHFSLPFFLNSRLFFCNRNQHISLVIRLF